MVSNAVKKREPIGSNSRFNSDPLTAIAFRTVVRTVVSLAGALLG